MDYKLRYKLYCLRVLMRRALLFPFSILKHYRTIRSFVVNKDTVAYSIQYALNLEMKLLKYDWNDFTEWKI